MIQSTSIFYKLAGLIGSGSFPGFYSSNAHYLSVDLIKGKVYYGAMDVFYALADPTRRKILELLASHGQLSATEICANFAISPPAISQHLKILREAKLVTMHKRAQLRIYQINPEAVLELEDWSRQLAQQWNQRLDALDELLKVEKSKNFSDKGKDS